MSTRFDDSPRSRGARWTAWSLVALLAALAAGSPLLPDSAARGTSRAAPNFVVIQLDDMAPGQLDGIRLTPMGLRVPAMPKTLKRIASHGISFEQYYVSFPNCCPSRVTLLSGRYSHSHGVLDNTGPRGGWIGFRKVPAYRHNLAAWLQEASYRTIHLGKFLNGYGAGSTPATIIPPGWDSWVTLTPDATLFSFYGYKLNYNGTIQGPFGEPDYGPDLGRDARGCPDTLPPSGGCNYSTDVLTAQAVGQIEASAPGRPFYLQLDYTTPHRDFRRPIGPEPAPRHLDSAIDTPLPRPPGFNEGDVSDKPIFIREDAELFNPATLRRTRLEYQKGLEALRAVDEGVADVVEALRRSGELANTYVIFTTDNGFFFGEHRLERAKYLPYEPAVHVPLLIRGPGIEPGSRSEEIVANVDLAPTVLRLAGARATRSFDGRPLIRFWRNPSLRTNRPILLESFVRATDIDDDGKLPPRDGAETSISAPAENYLGVRLGPYKYVEYETGDRELYYLERDPYELNNRVDDPRFDAVQAFLRRQLMRLENCLAAECKFTTGEPPLPAAGGSKSRPRG